jgi:hypothetical protein
VGRGEGERVMMSIRDEMMLLMLTKLLKIEMKERRDEISRGGS